jgi:2-oxoacid:acceptor oxidoreductase gamma subunit (pyruvate/2-ketoisovalerate family)
MIEIVIHGRGGQGGVTLAKLIAGAFYRRGLHVQAFGVYGAERTGAPVEAYVRADEQDIVAHDPVTAPDHVIVVDPSLLTASVGDGMRDGGWIIVNTAQPPSALEAVLPGRNVATVDASGIAVANGLGTRAVPIVNTALLGAVARLLGLDLEDAEGALADAGFGGANVQAVRESFGRTEAATEPGRIVAQPPTPHHVHLSFLDERVGGRPTTHTGAWASARPHARELAPPCSHACPAGNDVRGFVQAAAAGDDDRALAIILETSPLPGVCGRVCPAPCLGACNRAVLDGAVDVRDIERALADRGAAGGDPSVGGVRGGGNAGHAALAARRGAGPVAVVGSGPAGLSAVYQLAGMGYRVALYEAAAQPGGLLRTGIPEYRLPRAVLGREVARVLSRTAEVHTGRRVDRRLLEQLAGAHRAVFVATGLQAPRALRLSGAGVAVDQGLDFLAAAHETGSALDGELVVVAGGGTTAFDAARTALRLGAAEVHVAYRRTRGQMPAIEEEVAEALDEGVTIEELLEPVGLCRGGEHGLLTCRRMRLGEPDEQGRPRPVPVPGDEGLTQVRCDRLLLAVGQDADASLLPSGAVAAAGPLSLEGSSAPIYLGGDFAGGEGTVAGAIGSGRRAALAIHAVLAATDEASSPREARAVACAGVVAAESDAGERAGDAVAGPDRVHPAAFARAPGAPVLELSPRVRRRTFAEVRGGFAAQPQRDLVRDEAARCFACGLCTGCDTCVVYCPEGVLRRAQDGLPEADYDFCKGCGLCVATCPRGVVFTEAV